jgi:hypothetical protein
MLAVIITGEYVPVCDGPSRANPAWVVARGGKVSVRCPNTDSWWLPRWRLGGVKAVVAAGDAGRAGVAERLGIEPGNAVQELGWDEDVDDGVRVAIEEQIGSDLLDEDADEVVDVVLLWWREDDGDLVDALMDAMGPLADNGVIWVLTPKTGRDGHVEPSEIAEAVPTAGLAQTSNVSVGNDWSATRLVSPKSAKTKR